MTRVPVLQQGRPISIERFGAVPVHAADGADRKEGTDQLSDEPWSIEPGLNKKGKRKGRERYEEATASHDIRRKASGAMLYALAHPLRREALRVLNAAKEPITPKQMSDIMPWDLPGVSFHVRVLHERNLARCTRTQRVRGATKHFYVSRVAKNDLLVSILDHTKKDDEQLFEGLAT